MLADYEKAFGLNSVIFRYFNVAGADPDSEIGEFHQPETHLVPLILDTICGAHKEVTIFGTDYDTPDGHVSETMFMFAIWLMHTF